MSVGLWYQSDNGLIRVEKCYFLLWFTEESINCCIISSLNIWLKTHQWNYLGLGFPLWEDFKLLIQHIYLVKLYSDFLFLSWVNLVIFDFLGLVQFSLGTEFFSIIFFITFPHNLFNFWEVSGNIPFHYWFFMSYTFSYIPDCVANSLLISFTFLKNLCLVLSDFFPPPFFWFLVH